jgi:hypothetical protein
MFLLAPVSANTFATNIGSDLTEVLMFLDAYFVKYNQVYCRHK